MPNSLDTAVKRATHLRDLYGDDIGLMACLHHLHDRLLRAFGQRYGTDVQPLLDLQWRMTLSWLSAQHLAVVDLLDAIAALNPPTGMPHEGI